MMLLLLDVAQVSVDLAERRLACPALCPGTLRPWGYARPRRIRLLHAATAELRPRRVRCDACHRTHVLLPSWTAPRRAHGIDVIATALAGRLAGHGQRAIAADLDVAADTIRGWSRRLSDRAEQLRQHATVTLSRIEADATWIDPAATALTDALNALARLTDAVRRRFHPAAPIWTLLGGLGLAAHLTPAPSS
jgi:Domain of unknown function (DUF6431)